MKRLERVNPGDAELRRKINDLVDAVNALQTVRGDGIIQVSQSSSGLGIRLSVERLKERLPRADVGFRAVVIDGRDEGLDGYYFYTNNDVANDPIGLFIDEVTDGPGGTKIIFYPSRTRTADNVYIPTVLMLYWGCFMAIPAGRLYWIKSNPVPTVIGGSTFNAYNYVPGIFQIGEPCWFKVTDSSLKAESDQFGFNTYVVGKYTVGLGVATYDVPSLGTKRLWLNTDPSGGGGYDVYPTIKVDDYIPAAPISLGSKHSATYPPGYWNIAFRWYSMIPHIPVRSGAYPASNRTQIYEDATLDNVGRLWAYDNT